MRKINIAIDGYSSCGKSTLAKQVANHFNYIYVDSGAMYRSIALYALQHGIIKDNFLLKDDLIAALPNIEIAFKYNSKLSKSETFLNGLNVEHEIRGMEVSKHVSFISLIREVRQKLVAIQRKLGENKGLVMDGRDIGTAVFPDAELKIFMTADKHTRVVRRYEELKAKGIEVGMEEVQENLSSRDFEDTHRAENPLVQAPDARVIDNTDLSREEQFEMVKQWVEETLMQQV